jgi:ribosome biogenesis GTP-binding protein YsxC/EngB
MRVTVTCLLQLIQVLLSTGYISRTSIFTRSVLYKSDSCCLSVNRNQLSLNCVKKDTGSRKFILGSKVIAKGLALKKVTSGSSAGHEKENVEVAKDAVTHKYKAPVKIMKASSKELRRKSENDWKKNSEEKKKDRTDKMNELTRSDSSISVSTSSSSVTQVTASSDSEISELLMIDEDFKTALKDFRKANAPKKLLKAVAEYSETGRLDQNMTVHAFRTLQRMNRNDLCADLIPFWHSAVDRLADGRVDLEPTIALVKSCRKMQRMDLAESIAIKSGVNIERLKSLTGNDTINDPLSPFAFKAYSRILPELSLGYASIGSYPKALAALRMMYKSSIKIEIEMSKQILKMFLRETSPIDVRKCVRALLLINGLSDNDSIQLLTSTYMKSIDFVKGAVSMETLPPAECGEAAFIGRSNVGKSSLINMISNRKGIAFVSKTPGKTSEFNYFDAKGKVGKKNEKHRFYLVDLPGVGYAEVRKELRASWLVLLKDYVMNRDTLKIVFHLIDSRHGILDTDEDCLSLLGNNNNNNDDNDNGGDDDDDDDDVDAVRLSV